MPYKNTVLNSAMKPAPPPVLRATRLLDQVRERIRYKHYSLRTEQAYVQWVRMFVKWHGLRHPRDMGQLEIEGFLAMLANERRVAGGGCHAQPGVECTAVPLPRGVGHGPAMARGRATHAHAQAHSFGFDGR
ncbi:phage integrase N-terminal SAM-like domain-containing protein [Acidovorax temperans]|uniref:phage integrase N-terminal SAM-like domain-containing protein n=1 Tax=Acidovorax temperans TaxID=80878 RepID=UPI003D35253B